MKYYFLFSAFFFFNSVATAQQEIFLYEGTHQPTPQSDILSAPVDPSLTVWLPSAEKANGKAVIICPGGGYHILAIEREGHAIAREFNKAGIAAFVLKYRLPDKNEKTDQSSWPLQDAQAAIRMVRQRAEEWHIAPGKIGIMGFSAGGHLAATAGTHYNLPVIENPGQTNLRPDFMILVYPVISFSETIGHPGSRDNLLGSPASQDKINLYCNEQHVDATTPPAFLTHGSDDTVVPVANSLVFYDALKKHHIATEMHIYAEGEHGYIKKPPFDEWFGRCLYWLSNLDF
ncbi:MAG: alpha/beta hydrolase [Prevotellaceae bacterium]|jgi:acetyl esterase/lipase|nr:alpha/beta hydrolase [Prevotellaceae bacterium]